MATKIEEIETQVFIDDLLLTCIDSRGMGIASPQFFVSKRLFIMASSPNSRVINPEILSYSDEVEKDWEGCFSLPNLRAKVPCSIHIEVRYFTRDGEEVEEVLEGFLAHIF